MNFFDFKDLDFSWKIVVLGTISLIVSLFGKAAGRFGIKLLKIGWEEYLKERFGKMIDAKIAPLAEDIAFIKEHIENDKLRHEK